MFDLDPDLIYLNHAAVAPWPTAVARAVTDFAAQNRFQGAEHYPAWAAVEADLRVQLATLLNAPSSDDIALVKNTSEALSFVAAGLDWRPGDAVVGIVDDFPSNRLPWLALADQGVGFVGVDVNRAADPEAALIEALTADVRLLAVSSVHYATGLRIDLVRLGQACRDRGVLFCVDAIQSLGLIPFDVQACGADFVAADGHKWLLGPEGLGVFYCREELRPRLRLTQFGWHMVADVGAFDAPDWLPADSGRRFECGSPNMLGVHALAASVRAILETGVEHIFTHVDSLNCYLIEQAGEMGVSLAGGKPPETRRSGIVVVPVSPHDNVKIWQKLMADRVVTAPRGGGIRFSPHLHNHAAQIDKALASLARAMNA